MNFYILLQNLETKKYYGSYGVDDYWTSDIKDAKKFKSKDEITLDSMVKDFLSGSIVKIIECVEFN